MTADRFLTLLTYIQTHLDADLSLARLAKRAGLSPSHFHREFHRVVGETPRDYVERVRLERAAFRLSIHDDSVLTVALDVGYANHETFTRAFRRRFDVPPSIYRDSDSRLSGGHGRERESEGAYELSDTKPRIMKSITVAFVRHVGPYEAVPPDLWTRMAADLAERGFPADGPRIGIGHDSPAVTAPEQLRFDAGIIVPDGLNAGPDVAIQTLVGGPAAVTTHAGPYDSLPRAYPVIFERAMHLKGYEMVGLPAVEIYHCDVLAPERAINYTDIYLPLQKRR